MGLTSMLAVIVWTLWVVYQGAQDVTWVAAGLYALAVFAKGFIFGFVLALIYDCIAARCKGMCCRKSNGDGTGSCGCGNPNCKCK